PQPTGKTPSNQSWRAAAGGRRLREMLGMLGGGAAATKMAIWATQQPQRGGTTSCASRPFAGIHRARGLISWKATGEQEAIVSTVGRGGARRPRPGGGVAIEMLFRAGGPLRAT